MKSAPYFLTLILAATAAQSQPEAYSGLDPTAYHRLVLPKAKNSGNVLKLPVGNAEFNIPQKVTKNNLNQLSFESHNKFGHLNITLGHNSAFGEWHHQGKSYRITTEASGTWLVELPHDRLQVDNCRTDHNTAKATTFTHQTTSTQQTKAASTTLDVLVIHDRSLALRYPGDLLNTRVDHYVHVANQTFANSGLDLDVRLVGVEEVPYNHNNSNDDMLSHMQSTLSRQVTIAGLQDLPQMRQDTGADLVIAIRPHDIETRGSCGLAYYPSPNFNSSYGVNMVSDGMSSWSYCSDQVFAHEIGHNLGAAHQYGAGGGTFLPQGSAFIKLNQFNTVMGSFGTGQNNRSKRLPMFSNPNLICGGVACGVGIGDEPSNNVAVIQSTMNAVASYMPSVSAAPASPAYQRSDRDFDGDGINDWNDHFPFDPSEQSDTDFDGVGDNSDEFPNLADEQLDTDGDGTGNNADNDDDGDGFIDDEDAFPLDDSEHNDADFDGIGDNADAFPNRADENNDHDQDGIGDHQDTDDDNDGVVDVDTGTANTMSLDILVVNTGDNRILRFDAQTGRSLGIEVLPDDGVLTFQSDLSYDSNKQRLYFTSSSGVKTKDMMSRTGTSMLIPPYAGPPFREGQLALGTGFPTSLYFDNNQLLVSRIDRGTLSVFDDQNPLYVSQLGEWGIAPPELEESFIDIEKQQDYFLLGLDGRLYRGTSANDFIRIGATANPNLWEPLDMAITPDGQILVSDHQRKQILKYDDNGTFQSIHISLQQLGLGSPSGMAIANGLYLLVATKDDNKIHRFDLQTGEHLGVLVDGLGLNQPHKMIVVPSLSDRFHHDDQKVISPNAGQWFAAESAGRGFDIQVFDNRLNIIWYTFDEDGLPTWYISAGDLVGHEYHSQFDQTTQIDMDSVTIENVGDLDIEFINERQAEVSWRIGDATGTETINWHGFRLDPEDNNYTGLWGRPDGPGWGISLATVGDTSVSIAFLYDAMGKPRWVISEPVSGPAPLEFNYLFVTSDTLCPSCSGESSFNISHAGTMRMDFNGQGDWDSNIQWPDPVVGSWQVDDVPLFRFSQQPIRPR